MASRFLLILLAYLAASNVIVALPAPSEQEVEARSSEQPSLAQKILSSALQPYSALLYFREALVDEDMSSAVACHHDADCGSDSSSFCGQSGVCESTLSIHTRCSRDEMCSTGYCHSSRVSGSRCASKRVQGQSCRASPTSACAEGLFCSLGDKRCTPKRGLHQTCRLDNACADGLACVNGKCQESLKPTTTLKDTIKAMEKRHFWPQPSGSWDQPHWFGKREDDVKNEKRTFWPQPSGSWDQPHWFAARSNDETEQDFERRTFWPQPSGSWDQPHWFGKREDNEQSEKRTFWPQPSGSWQQPHWFAARSDDETDNDVGKRTFWPQPSGSWQQPHWFAVKREQDSNPGNPVVLRRREEEP